MRTIRLGFSMRLLFLAITALLLQTSVLLAQTPAGVAFGERRLEFDRLTVNDGLSQNFVTCILQDHQGFLWIGTRDGLNRYDGYEFKVYSFDALDTTSLSANAIQSIFEDRNNNLWVGTRFRWLNKYDRATDRFVRYRYEQGNPSSLPLDVSFPIQDDRSGLFWLGTAEGLKRFDPQTGKFTSFIYKQDDLEGRKYNYINTILEAEDGNLWLGTMNEYTGLLYFNRSTETFSPFKVDPKNFIEMRPLIIRAINRDQSGNLWVGDAAGLFRINEQWLLDQVGNPAANERPGSQEGLVRVAGALTEIVSALGQDEAGHLWLSTNKGISRFDPERKVFRNYDITDGLQSNEFNRGAYHRSRHGEMFFGGLNGLNVFFPQALKDNPHLPPVVITGFKLFNKPVGPAKNEENPLKKVIAVADEIRLSY
jgi:ligand-binding sensor domain-containing protein